MGEREWLGTVGAFYDAVAGEASWDDAGECLKRVVQAQTATLWVGDPAAGRVETLYRSGIPDSAVAPYVKHFHALDPWVAALSARPGHGERLQVWLGPEVVPLAAYDRGEFYRDYARDIGLYHVVGAVLPLGGGTNIAPLGLHRPEDAEPFGEAERHALTTVLPHLHGALRLRQRLGEAVTGFVALDALPFAVFIVDVALRVVFANVVAERLAADRDGVRFTRAGPHPGDPIHLTAVKPCEALALAALVQATVLRGTPARGLRLARAALSDALPLAALVAPLPARLAPPGQVLETARLPGHVAKLALVLIRDLASPTPLPARLVQMFGLTAAEAETATALAGGTTAEMVAATRRVSVETVRTQIRAILVKTGASSLRHLERLFASLPAALETAETGHSTRGGKLLTHSGDAAKKRRVVG